MDEGTLPTQKFPRVDTNVPAEGRFEEILKKARANAKITIKATTVNTNAFSLGSMVASKKGSSIALTKQEALVESDPIYTPLSDAFTLATACINDDTVEFKDSKDKIKKPPATDSADAKGPLIF
jgi:hypothetical protein